MAGPDACWTFRFGGGRSDEFELFTSHLGDTEGSTNGAQKGKARHTAMVGVSRRDHKFIRLRGSLPRDAQAGVGLTNEGGVVTTAPEAVAASPMCCLPCDAEYLLGASAGGRKKYRDQPRSPVAWS